MNDIFVNNIGNLSDNQHSNYYNFIKNGISYEFQDFPNPFFININNFSKNKIPCFIYLYPNKIKLKGPKINLEECIKYSLSYTLQIFVEIQYSYFLNNSIIKTLSKNKSKLIFKQNLFIAEVPLITDEGTFILHGCERIVINQIIRNPGIYFQREFSASSKKIINCTATIISNNGSWTKFILDTIISFKTLKAIKKKKYSLTNRIYLKLNNFNNEEIILEDYKKSKDKIFIFDFLKCIGINNFEIKDNIKYIKYFKNYQIKTLNIIDKKTIAIIKESFFNKNKSNGFYIGTIGRLQINKQLNLSLPKNVECLTLYDYFGIINELIELKYYQRFNDNIDNLANKRIRSIGDLLQQELRIGLYKLKKDLNKLVILQQSEFILLLNNKKEFSNEITERSLTPFINSEDKIKIIFKKSKKQINFIPIKFITRLLKSFFTKSHLSQYMDQVNPLAEVLHKRKVTVLGPNGLKKGNISMNLRDIQSSQYGRLCPIETAEGQNAGLISTLSLYSRTNTFGTIETPYFFIKKKEILIKKNPYFLTPSQEICFKIGFSNSHLININKNYISVKENSFFGNEKLSKTSFVTISPSQIFSLGIGLVPFLEHDDANRVLMGSNMQRQAVPLMYPQKVIVGTGLEINCLTDSGLIIKNYSEGIVIQASSKQIKVKDFSGQIITYFLKKYLRSNQKTCINQNPIVWNKEFVFSGQIIADGPSSIDGELALGTNLLVAYMSWEGYNYEDAIIINENLILNDILTSIHIQEYQIDLFDCLNGYEHLNNDEIKFSNLDKNGIIKIGTYIKENDILINKNSYIKEEISFETKFLQIISNSFDMPIYKNTSLLATYGCTGYIIDIRRLSRTILNSNSQVNFKNSSEILKIYVAQIRKIEIGDKLSGRHGNKGIISRVLANSDMPYLPDGRSIDILLNPLGVPSRMNVGQIFESLLGFAGFELGSRFFISSFDENYGKESSRFLINQKLKEISLKTKLNYYYNSTTPGKILLKDGRTGEYFDNLITVGKSYIIKLIHLVQDKIHARSVGPYSAITEQPVAGRANNGGQRFGEMEVWALEAFGCSKILQELLNIKSDDIEGRQDMYVALSTKLINKPQSNISEGFLTLIRELNALGLNLEINQIDIPFETTKEIKKLNNDIFKDLEIRLQLRTFLSIYNKSIKF